MYNTFCYFPGSDTKGETQDSHMKIEGAFEVLGLQLGAENSIDIGSVSSGGGAGKATFKELTIEKKADLASAKLFNTLTKGEHYDDMTIELRRSGDKWSFLKWEFKLVMIQDIVWSCSEGDDICYEEVIMQYGAMKVTYTGRDQKGPAGEPEVAEWSRVRNEESLAV